MPNLSSSGVSPSAAHLHDITPFTRAGPQTTVIIGLSVTVEINVGRPVPESFTISDSCVIHKTYVRSVLETPAISSDTTRFKRANPMVEELVTITDAVIRRIVQSKTLGEAISVIVLVGRSSFSLRTLAESLEIAASVVGQRLTFRARSVSESLAVSEDGFVRWCSTAGQLKKIIRHQLGRFFSVLPQRNLRAYTFDSNLVRQKEKQQ